jgi:glucosyl-3-phosphoglycerate synthase
MNSMLEEGLRTAAGNSTLSTLAPAVVLVPMLNLGHAPDMLQLAVMLTGPATMDRATNQPDPQSSVLTPQSSALPRIIVLSVVAVPPGEPLTMGLDMARSYRALLDFLPSEVEVSGRQVRVDRVVKVARDVATAIRQAAYEEHADMVLLYWKGYAREPKRHLFGRIADATLKSPPCSVMLARLEGWRRSRRVFLPVRGGPAAEQALHIGVSLAERMGLPMAVMHNVPPTTSDERRTTNDDSTKGRRLSTGELTAMEAGITQVEALGEEPYIVFNEHLRRVRERTAVPVESILTRQPDPVEALLDEARGDDILIMGLPSPEDGGDHASAAASSVALRVSNAKGPPLLLLNTPASIDLAGYARKVRAGRSKKRWVDMPFEHWFVEHTYHGDEFKDPEEFLKAKRASGVMLSVGILTSNDSKHIHSVLTGLKRVLVEMHPIADQIVVVDAGSTDGTVEIARGLGVEVFQSGEILPAQGDLHGRGECWWKSLAVLHGDIIVWLDPRARHFHPGTALSLAGPLLRVSTLQLVKAFGQTDTPDGPPRAARKKDDFSPVDMSWGGFVVPRRDSESPSDQVRVQALKPSDLASLSPVQIGMLPPRTLVQVLSPSLAGVVAPFSRDIAARREAMLALPVFAGENLDLGLLLSVAAEFGTNAIAQVELRHHQPGPPPAPGVRSAIDILQAMSYRLHDPGMRKYAAEITDHLQKELEGKRATPRSEGAASMFEVRALGPVERPPMRRVLNI